MYSINEYAIMMKDEGRMHAYKEALRAAVNKDSVVLDLGAGTGIFALLACKFGAKKVYALEPDNVIQVAREIARENGFEGRIEFIQATSLECDLPEKVDVIISDLRGRMPFFRQHLPAIIDARERLLKPGGKLIPAKDSLWATLVSAPDIYEEYTKLWSDGYEGLKMSAASRFTRNRLIRIKPSEERYRLAPVRWGVLDYHTISQTTVQGDARWDISEPATLHGIQLWFDTELNGDTGFSNAPGQPEHIYSNVLLPFMEPVSVNEGDRVEIMIKMHLVGEDYVWNWQTRVTDPECGDIKQEFRQSTFFGTPVSLTDLKKREAKYRPQLSEAGKIDSMILQMLADGAELGKIARQLQEKFPERFPEFEKALARVSDLSARYCK